MGRVLLAGNYPNLRQLDIFIIHRELVLHLIGMKSCSISFTYQLTMILTHFYYMSTLTSLSDHQVISCVDYFPSDTIDQCHFYTYPYTILHYDNITNNFSSKLFKC
ncbi:unnamed protein product, partial [Rotaria sp. Silwood2]